MSKLYNGIEFDTPYEPDYSYELEDGSRALYDERTEEEFENYVLKNSWPIVRNMKGRRLCGKFIGTVEIVIDRVFDYDDGYDYVTEDFLAYKLDHGPIVAVEYHIDDLRDGTKTPVFSLAKKMFSIREGYYPIGFPTKWMTVKPEPAIEVKGISPIEPDELPF